LPLADRRPKRSGIRSQRLNHDTASRGTGNPDHVGWLHDRVRKVSDRGSNLIVLLFWKAKVVNNENNYSGFCAVACAINFIKLRDLPFPAVLGKLEIFRFQTFHWIPVLIHNPNINQDSGPCYIRERVLSRNQDVELSGIIRKYNGRRSY
jgi:hypothetical protein